MKCVHDHGIMQWCHAKFGGLELVSTFRRLRHSTNSTANPANRPGAQVSMRDTATRTGSNHHKKAPIEACSWELREAPAPGVWIRPCSLILLPLTPATQWRVPPSAGTADTRGFSAWMTIQKKTISASSGSQRTRQRYHTYRFSMFPPAR